jgi:hypothetical protein
MDIRHPAYAIPCVSIVAGPQDQDAASKTKGRSIFHHPVTGWILVYATHLAEG